jgi:propionyl-CoA synthetase
MQFNFKGLPMTMLAAHHHRSLNDRDAFWAQQATRIHWNKPFTQTLDYSQPPFCRWFVGGETNLCYNAVDRWADSQPDARALIWRSTEVHKEITYSYADLKREVQVAAAMLQSLGVTQGDRVLIYMPMVPEAVFMMLACTRIGALHSVVFGGFASVSLASRIDDAQPKVVVSADAGSRTGKVVPYKALLDEAIQLAAHKPSNVIMFNRGLADMPMTAGRDVDYATLAAQQVGKQVACVWVESSHPSYTLYTSGTTGKPKGVQRDTGGYAVALAASMEHVFCGKPGEAFLCSSDIGWVVGHSYIVYGTLIGGMATVLFEGTPVQPDAGILWEMVEKYQVTVMFSSPTAVRVLKKHDIAYLTQYNLKSLRSLFLAGEPLDEPTAKWISEGLGVPVIDNYWQTESGWPILSASHGVEKTPTKYGSPSFPTSGYNVQVINETTGEQCAANEKGVVMIQAPLPPGCLSTIWGDDERFVKTYFVENKANGQLYYNTFDWGIKDADGYYFILGRTDDVINVAGHRLGTREIEESINCHTAVAECAVVGVADALKGQVAVAFAVVKQASSIANPDDKKALETAVMRLVDGQLGAVARPARVHFVTTLPKTRSGKVLRRAIQALCEGRDAGDLTTIEDASALQQIRDCLAA